MNTINADHFDDQSTYLFQRVREPNKRQVYIPFAFGGGGSGLSNEAAGIIAKILDWDYMGASEFECGICANCLNFMNENAKELESTENKGFFFLTHMKMTKAAHELWQEIVKKSDKLYHSPRLDNPEIVDWFDFTNGWFVSRTAEMHDNLHKILLDTE